MDLKCPDACLFNNQQATRRLAHLRAESALRQWQEEGLLAQAPSPEQQAAAQAATTPILVHAFNGLSLATTRGAGEAVAAAASSCASARALCERVRQQARRKLREERKRVLQARQAARDEARKHAATAAAVATAVGGGASTALIPVTESVAARQLAFAERAMAFQRQQRLQAALAAWQQLAAAATAKQELERELCFRLEAAGALLVRAQLRLAFGAWRAGAAAAAKEEAVEQGLGLLVAVEQRRALRVWRCAAPATKPDEEQVKAAPVSVSHAATGAGDLGQGSSGPKGTGRVWFAAACDWLRDELARVVAPPRRKADADEYLDCM